MTRTLVSVFCLLCLALSASHSAGESISCIVFPQYFSPHHTYYVELYTEDNGACCELCAQDDKCVAWTREEASGRCSLKDDADVLVGAIGVDSGIKYKGDAVPELVSNGVGASVIVGKEPHHRPEPESSTSVSAVAVASSSSSSSSGGGPSSSSAEVIATPSGVSSRSSVSGTGAAYTAAETPKVSLATALTKERDEAPEYAVAYYEKPSIVGEVSTTEGKTIPLVVAENDDSICYKCEEFPCLFKKGVSYRDGVLIADFHTEDQEHCCRACKEHDNCISWWRNPDTKRCVMNSNLPEGTTSEVVYGGTVL